MHTLCSVEDKEEAKHILMNSYGYKHDKAVFSTNKWEVGVYSSKGYLCLRPLSVLSEHTGVTSV